MTSAESAISRTPPEIWMAVIEILFQTIIESFITFVPKADTLNGFWFTYVNREFRIDAERKWESIPTSQEYYSVRSVSKSWKVIADSLGYLLRSRVLKGIEIIQTGGKGEVGRLHLKSPDYDGEPCTQLAWRSNLESNPRVVQVKIDDPILYTEYQKDYFFDTLLLFGGKLHSLRCLELRTNSRNRGIMELISTHFPNLITLDIRIQFTESTRSTIDVENLNLPNLETLRIDTDRWTLYEDGMETWSLPNLRAVNLAANGGCYSDSNPSALMIRNFFLTFGAKLTHICCFVCVNPVDDSRLHITWESMPNLRELVTHPAVQFQGPAPRDSMLERVVIMERTAGSIHWLEEMFDPAFSKQSTGDTDKDQVKIQPMKKEQQGVESEGLTICLGYARWPKGGYTASSESGWYEQGQDLASFCSKRGWRLEDGRGRPWKTEWNELNLHLPAYLREEKPQLPKVIQNELEQLD